MKKYGMTHGCNGCVALSRRKYGIPRNDECRTRIEKQMSEDPAGRRRVEKSKLKMDEAVAERLEEAMEEGKEGEAR